MSNQVQGNGTQGGGTLEIADATRFLGQLTLLPFSAFLNGLEIIIQLVNEMQRIANQSINKTVNRAAGTSGSAPSGTGSSMDRMLQTSADAGRRGSENAQHATREEERKMSDQSWSSGNKELDTSGGDWSSSGGSDYARRDDDWRVSEDCRKQDPCDRLRLVRFKILFLKRNLEVAFQEQEELVSEDMNRDGFISWKIAEFIQQMTGERIEQPPKWQESNDYPANADGQVKKVDGKSYVTSLPDKDKRYLRVYSQVLAWYDREKRNYERDQADVLGEIRDVLRSGTITVKNI